MVIPYQLWMNGKWGRYSGRFTENGSTDHAADAEHDFSKISSIMSVVEEYSLEPRAKFQFFIYS